MTALHRTRTGRRLADARRHLALAWPEFLERRATSGPRLGRVPFEAELAFEAWLATAWPADRRRAQRQRLAGWLHLGLALVLTLAAVGRQLAGMASRGVRRAAHHLEGRDQLHVGRSALSGALLTAVLGAAAASAIPAASAERGGRTVAGPVAAVSSAPREAEAPARHQVARPAPQPGPMKVVARKQPPSPPTLRGALPVGKGMWIWHPEATEGGNPDAIVARAEATGLTHVYVWLGSSISGFATPDFLRAFLPVAHAHGLRVYGWDFPYLDNADFDVDRAVADINFTTPSGDRIDGFAADIELRSMGVNISPLTADVYTTHLRTRVGPNYPLIAVVPRPNPLLVSYPFAEVIRNFDAVAPMVYWLGGDPVAQLNDAMQALAPFHKPILPIGQAYDGRNEGGPPGVPPRAQLLAFMQRADELGATGVSWWSWQHADQQAWDAVRDAPQFVLETQPKPLSAGQIRAYQVLLSSLGFPVDVTGSWDSGTFEAVKHYQQAAHLPVTGFVDATTRKLLLTPFRSPVANG